MPAKKTSKKSKQTAKKTKPGKSSKPTVDKLKQIRISELQRTVLLFVLLFIALAALSYIQNNVDNNFVDQL